MLPELLDAVLAQTALPAAYKLLDQVLGVLGHVRDVSRKLETLLETRERETQKDPEG